MAVCGAERACKKIISENNIDVIHTHFFEPFGESLVISATSSNIPIISTLRGAELCNMPEFDYGGLRDPFFRTMIKYSLKLSRYITAPNKYLCHKLITEFNVNPDKVYYLPNGVEDIRVKKNYKVQKDILTFISICNLIKLKNLDIIIDSLDEVAKSYTNFEVIIVGSGPLKESYIKSIKKLNFKNIKIINELPKLDLYKLILECDCLIHPSFSEGMPNVVLECLSIGIPCIVSRIPVHEEIIHEGINGFFINPHDKASLIYKMKYIIKNKEILQKMSKKCINSVNSYSIENKINGYLKLYNNLLRNSY